MSRTLVTVGLVAFSFLWLGGSSTAQQWSGQQTEVWTMISEAWKADMAEEEWVQKFVHEKAMGWGPENPTPRNKSSIDRWSRYNHETGDVLEYELALLRLVVHGDTAVAHYYSSVAIQKVGAESPETEHTRWTDVLVRDGGTWQFIAWHGNIVGQN